MPYNTIQLVTKVCSNPCFQDLFVNCNGSCLCFDNIPFVQDDKPINSRGQEHYCKLVTTKGNLNREAARIKLVTCSGKVSISSKTSGHKISQGLKAMGFIVSIVQSPKFDRHLGDSYYQACGFQDSQEILWKTSYRISTAVSWGSCSGLRFNIKTVFPGMGISILKTFIMGIPIMVRQHIYIKTASRLCMWLRTTMIGLTEIWRNLWTFTKLKLGTGMDYVPNIMHIIHTLYFSMGKFSPYPLGLLE